MRKVFITGVTGQLGSYLSEYFINKGDTVYGLIRRTSTPNLDRLKNVMGRSGFVPIYGDVTDISSLGRPLYNISPLYVINCAAQSHVGVSFDQPLSTAQITGVGCLNLLEVCRNMKDVRFLQLSSSEMMGSNVDSDGFQRESTEFKPNSPYAASKLFAHNMVSIYRRSYDMFASTAICFNYESPRRSTEFVTKKITDWLARNYVKYGDSLGSVVLHENDKLKLGNIDSFRDWTHVSDTVDGLVKIIEHGRPGDFVLSSGETWSVRDFLTTAFSELGLDWDNYVCIDKSLFRPCEVSYLKGDNRKARTVLGWSPKVSFKDLVKDMLWSDIRRIKG